MFSYREFFLELVKNEPIAVEKYYEIMIKVSQCLSFVCSSCTIMYLVTVAEGFSQCDPLLTGSLIEFLLLIINTILHRFGAMKVQLELKFIKLLYHNCSSVIYT